MITDDDSQDFTSLDEANFLHFVNAARNRCGQHLIAKSYEKHGPKISSFIEETSGVALCLEINRWVRTWVNGNSCVEESQFELSKKILFNTLSSNKEVINILGEHACTILLAWINTNILVHSKNSAFHHKKYLLYFNEYKTNSCEGMNVASKHETIAAKPNLNMDTVAKAMGNYQGLKDQKATPTMEPIHEYTTVF